MKEKQIVFKTHSDYSIIESYNFFINSQIRNSYFQSISFYKTLLSSKSIKPVSLVLTDINNNIVASAIGELKDEIEWLPLLTRRLILYAPPLYTELEYLSLLLSNLVKLKAGQFIQIRTFYEFSKEEIDVYSLYGFTLSSHLNAYIKLEQETKESVLSSLQKDKKKGIKKAVQKFGIVIEEFNDTKHAIDLFYSLLRNLYIRKRHPLKNKSYFYNLVSNSQGAVKLAFAVYEGVPIAAQLYVIYNSTITALYTATHKEHTNKHAGDLLVWYLIEKGIENKCEIFDFGGGGNPKKKYSPRDYKARFGTKFQDVGRLNLPLSPMYKVVMNFYTKQLR